MKHGVEDFNQTGRGIKHALKMNAKLELPKYAWPYQHPAARKGDVGASFYEDEGGGTIAVSIERGEGGQFYLGILRGGIAESGFTRGELAKVTELIGLLQKAI